MKLFKNLIEKLRSPHPFKEQIARWFYLDTIFYMNLLTAFPLYAQIGFQSPGTPVMEGIIDFHHDLMFFLIYILGFVVWFLCVIGYSFYNRFPSTRDLNLLIYKHHINFIRVPSKQNHHLWLEVVWTVIPALILISIVLPSFALIYSMDEFLLRPRVTLKAIGNQWYWTYNYGCSLSTQGLPGANTDEISAEEDAEIFDEILAIILDEISAEEGRILDDNEIIRTSSGIPYNVSDAKFIRHIFRIFLDNYFIRRAHDNGVIHMLPIIAKKERMLPYLKYVPHRNFDYLIRLFREDNIYQFPFNDFYDELISTFTIKPDYITEQVFRKFMFQYVISYLESTEKDMEFEEGKKYPFARFCIDSLNRIFSAKDPKSLLQDYDSLLSAENSLFENTKKIEQALHLRIVLLGRLIELLNEPSDEDGSELTFSLRQELLEFLDDYETYKELSWLSKSILESMSFIFASRDSDNLLKDYDHFLLTLPENLELLTSYFLLSLDSDGLKDFFEYFYTEIDWLRPFYLMGEPCFSEFLKCKGFTISKEDLAFLYDAIGHYSRNVKIPLEIQKTLSRMLFNIYFTGDTKHDLRLFIDYFDQLRVGQLLMDAGFDVPNNPMDDFSFSPSLQDNLTIALEYAGEVKPFASLDNDDNVCLSCQAIKPEPTPAGRRHFALKFDSYMLPTDMLEHGHLRLLEVDKRVLLPTRTGIRLLVSSYDVLHSWAVPAFGIKLDGCPGRLNQTFIYIKKEGLYYGQCSEICGVNHAFMPIVIKAVDPEEFNFWLLRRIEIFNALAETTDTHKFKMTTTDEPGTAKSDVVSDNTNNND